MTTIAYIRGVTTIELDPLLCNGCMMCIKVCPHPVFEALKRMVEIREPDDDSRPLGELATEREPGLLEVGEGQQHQ